MSSTSETPQPAFPVVGLGASAGGLAAFEAFLDAMPAHADTRMALVLVQHLSPDHDSMLAELVARHTTMEVKVVTDGMKIEPGCAYIIPPNRDMALFHGALRLIEPTGSRAQHRPIDYFFRSLATEQGERAIAIVLSGTGTDGTLGARAIKDNNGLVIVQESSSAEFDGMPRSALAAGVADLVLPPAEMPAQILEYLGHVSSPEKRTEALAEGEGLMTVCMLLRDHTGHDFSQYKSNTMARRIQRRMAIHRIEDIDSYVRLLREREEEIHELFRDLLIGVTSFFRDPEAFATLAEQVIPKLFADRSAADEVRIWVAGCSTGEEAYSIAILVQEHLESIERAFPVQIFATDIDGRAIEQARQGAFPGSIANDVSPERLERFFSHDPTGDTYRIDKSVRDKIIFSEHSITKDPPFSRLDLLVVRNLLIYMDAALQRRLIPLFHYALKPEGVLFLGTAESLGDHAPLFTSVSRKWKVYRPTNQRRAAKARWRPFSLPAAAEQGPVAGPRVRRQLAMTPANLTAVLAQAVLQHVAPVAVLIDGRGEILYIHGRTGQFLEPAPGDPGMNILDMARAGLRRELTTAVHRAVTDNRPIRYAGLELDSNGERLAATVTVRPVELRGASAPSPPLFLVVFEASEKGDSNAAPAPAVERLGDEDADSLSRLQRELRAKEDYLQSTLEELETSNEELRSSNEELQSVNEELQSTNEELETSKEEMQSVNEELATVNAELQSKVTDLSRVNNDMNNLLAGTGVGTLFVDHELRIARFTPSATQVINLIQSDVGRPVEHTVTNLVNYDRLVEDIQHVLDSLTTVDAEVQTKAGTWYLMRIRPYRTLANVIEGAVITFVDINLRKQAEAEVREAKQLAEAIVQTIRDPLLVLDEDARVLIANDAFCRTFGLLRTGIIGEVLYDIAGGQWDIASLRDRLKDTLRSHTITEGFGIVQDFPGLGRRRIEMTLRRMERTDPGARALALLVMQTRADPPAGA